MGNTIPSPALASGGGQAPPDARQFLQAEWKKCIIQVSQWAGRSRDGGRGACMGWMDGWMDGLLVASNRMDQWLMGITPLLHPSTPCPHGRC